MKKIDTRVQYTKEMFHRALLNLMETKPINKITIKELCEAASLNRGTFYLHYTEPQDILTEIEDDFIEENMSFLTRYLSPEHDTDPMSLMYSHMLKNQDTYRLIIGKGNDTVFQERLKKLVKSTVLQDWERDNPNCKREDLEFVFDYVFAGSIRMILGLDQDGELSMKEFAHRLDRLGHYAQLAIREFHYPQCSHRAKYQW